MENADRATKTVKITELMWYMMEKNNSVLKAEVLTN